MKKILIAIIAILCLCPFSALRADGPPVDQKTGKLTCKSIRFDMDAKQVQQAERIGYVELSGEQIQKLKKMNPEFDAKLLMIVPVPYQDCTCGMGVYGIWNRNASFEIPVQQIRELYQAPEDSDGEEIEGYGDEYELPKNFTIDSVAAHLSRCTIFIALDGKFYIRGEQAPIESILTMIDEVAARIKMNSSAESRTDDPQDLYISTPVLTDKKVKAKVFAAMKQIKQHAKLKDVPCWDTAGFDQEKK